MIDDDADILELMRFALEQRGAHVETVQSAAAALDKLATGRYDVLVAIWVYRIKMASHYWRRFARTPSSADNSASPYALWRSGAMRASPMRGSAQRRASSCTW